MKEKCISPAQGGNACAVRRGARAGRPAAREADAGAVQPGAARIAQHPQALVILRARVRVGRAAHAVDAPAALVLVRISLVLLLFFFLSTG